MKLSVKINFILLPVMIVVFSIAGIFSYNTQTNLLFSSLSDEIKYELQRIAGSLEDSVREVDFLNQMALGSQKIQRLLSERESGGDKDLLQNEFLEYINQLDLRNNEIKSFGLLDAEKNEIIFIDYTDPFASFHFTDLLNVHLAYIDKNIKEQGISYIEPSRIQYHTTEEGENEITLIRTFSPEQPISSLSFSKGHSIYTAIISVTLRHEKSFLDLLKNKWGNHVQLTVLSRGSKSHINGDYELKPLPQSVSGFGFQLIDQLWDITITISDSYLVNLYRPYQILFIFIVLLVTCATFLIIKFLIKIQIIAPVIKLTKQVQKASFGNEIHIQQLQGNDEISLLTNKYHDLIMDINDSTKRDTLTGLPNRKKFNLNLKRIVDKSIQHGEKCAVIFFDLDNFKKVNDKYGHQFGDELLREFSQQLVESVVDFDWDKLGVAEFEFARISGDEFTIIISDIKRLEVLNVFAKKIMSLFEDGFKYNGQHLDLGISIGISVCPDDAENIFDIVKNADTAMYYAKRDPKNSYKFYSLELESEMKYYDMISASLKEALQLEEFYLVFMPIFDCQDGSLKGAEALLRSTSTHLLSCGPDEFIPVAESTGLIKEIDYWVIDASLQHLAQWIKDFDFDGILAINFSSWQLKNPHFVNKVASLIKKHQIPPQHIELEITETCFVPGEIRNVEMLSALHRLGVKLSLDDFGTGFTAFSQLIDYPVDSLKIDRMFIDAISADHSQDKTLVDIIVEIGKLYDLNVIAEGVETELQLECIRKLGCQQAQGFLLSKPISEDVFINLWKSNHNLDCFIQSFSKFN
ncbi:putative bifunctional diguanylate cyclase/phosphodiesterase [Psychromonas sp. PT13]|uniref:putative bifunctional diguanylate cyclase/phosphodiesterase n=1 Tax=Psychromonas sp. PT13 TaxID=3439547 RepID=UPI003EC0C36A